MTARYFADSNVLIYARDVVDVAKQQRTNLWLEFLWDPAAGRLSYQVLLETYAVLTARHKLHSEEARVYLADFLAWHPMILDWTVMQNAWQVQDRYRLNWWDCMIVAAASMTDCYYLLTEDLQHGQELDGIIVVSPFEVEPGAVQ
jgi:predicted nucleic acid-binding protein